MLITRSVIVLRLVVTRSSTSSYLFDVCFPCMRGLVSYERLLTIFVSSCVLVNFAFFKITSYCLIACFPWLSSGQTTAYLEGSTFNRLSSLFHSFQTTKAIAVSFPVKNSSCSKFPCRSPIFISKFAHPSNHLCIIPLQSDHIFFFNWPSQGLIQSSNLGVGRVMPSLVQPEASPWLTTRGNIFKIADSSGQLVPTFLSKH